MRARLSAGDGGKSSQAARAGANPIPKGIDKGTALVLDRWWAGRVEQSWWMRARLFAGGGGKSSQAASAVAIPNRIRQVGGRPQSAEGSG